MEIKIIEIHDSIEFGEPTECDACDDEHNGFYHVKLKLFRGFVVWLDLCEKCFKRLTRFSGRTK